MSNHKDNIRDEEYDKFWNEMCEWLNAELAENEELTAQLERMIYWNAVNETLYQDEQEFREEEKEEDEEEELSAMCEPDYEQYYWESVIQQYIDNYGEEWR